MADERERDWYDDFIDWWNANVKTEEDARQGYAYYEALLEKHRQDKILKEQEKAQDDAAAAYVGAAVGAPAAYYGGEYVIDKISGAGAAPTPTGGGSVASPGTSYGAPSSPQTVAPGTDGAVSAPAGGDSGGAIGGAGATGDPYAAIAGGAAVGAAGYYGGKELGEAAGLNEQESDAVGKAVGGVAGGATAGYISGAGAAAGAATGGILAVPYVVGAIGAHFIDDDNLKRPFIVEEILGDEKSVQQLNRQLPGFAQASPEVQRAILEDAHAKGYVRLPGRGEFVLDEEGNKIKDAEGNPYIKTDRNEGILLHLPGERAASGYQAHKDSGGSKIEGTTKRYGSLFDHDWKSYEDKRGGGRALLKEEDLKNRYDFLANTEAILSQARSAPPAAPPATSVTAPPPPPSAPPPPQAAPGTTQSADPYSNIVNLPANLPPGYGQANRQNPAQMQDLAPVSQQVIQNRIGR